MERLNPLYILGVPPYVGSHSDDIQTIRTAILNNDSKGLQKAAHSFKSAVSLFKVSDMIELVIKLEQMGKEEKLEEAKQAIDQLELLIAKFIEDVKNILCATN